MNDGPADWLFGRLAGGVRWGLGTTTALLAGVGNPHRRFQAIHIGGTNGKGSVAALCDAALRSAGTHRVGLYTSPHLIRFNERIRIDGRPVDDAVLRDAADRLRPLVERTGASFFEATTALAFLLFAEAGVQVAVVEVGLGGRLDATNVLHPVTTAVTNVDVDHTEYLGRTLREIAREKAGIWKPGVAALTAEREPETLAELGGRAAQVGAPFATLDEICHITDVETGPDGTRLRMESAQWGSRRLGLALPGAHQARNAAFAAEVLGALPGPFRPSWRALERGFASCRWPGRLQTERVGSTTWLFDVAHNAAGAEALATALGGMALPRPLVLLVGVLADKAWQRMLPPLLERVDGAVLSVPPSAPVGRRWDPAAAADALQPPAGVALRVITDWEAALQRVTTLAPHGTVVVTGSVHTVGDAMQALGIPIA